ncbi:MAG: transglycosylase SLT domain-containing protein [Candidatus Binatia bacterium]
MDRGLYHWTTEVVLFRVIVALTILFSYSCYPQRPPLPPSALPPPNITEKDLHSTYSDILQGDTTEKRRELFRLGYHLLQEKNRDGARLLLTRALEVYPVLADYSLYFLGVLNREDGRTSDARTYLSRLREEYGHSLWTSQAALELASLALSEEQWDEAIRYAEQARSGSFVRATTKRQATLVLAQAQEGRSNIATAYQQYQEVRRIAPRSQEARVAKENVIRLRTRATPQFSLRTEQEYLDEIQLQAKEGDSSGTEQLVEQFRTKFPTSANQPEVLSILASTYKSQRRTTDAIRVWQEIADRYPDTNIGATALFRVATLLWNADRNDEALKIFQRITQQSPRRPRVADSWYAIGRIYQGRGADAQALAAYERLISLFPRSQLAREGRWRQAWIAYRNKDFAVAEQRFAALARSGAKTIEGESALYWQARATDQQNNTERAQTLYRTLLKRYPDSYYAVWAEKRLGQTPAPLPVSYEEPFVSPPQMSLTTESHYLRSLELREIGLPGFARRELDIVREDTTNDASTRMFFLTEYSRVDGHHRALRLAQRLSRSGGNWRRYFYPQAYWTLVNANANEKRLDPYLILSIMRQESVFDPDALSPADAHGLMQLLPSTASRVSGITPESNLPLNDPSFNIGTGTAYLRQLLDRYQGNFILAVAAYNSGENAVDRWLRRYPGLAPDEFVEHISYRETRNYVRKVLQNYRTYLRMYGSGVLPEIVG